MVKASVPSSSSERRSSHVWSIRTRFAIYDVGALTALAHR
jgi:hypothetical protein